jgi:hypothetical protein
MTDVDDIDLRQLVVAVSRRISVNVATGRVETLVE